MSWTKSTELIKIEANLLRNISVGNSFASNSHNKSYRNLVSDNIHMIPSQSIHFVKKTDFSVTEITHFFVIKAMLS